jgi:hypothetical protein
MKSRCSIVFLLTALATFSLPCGTTAKAQDYSHIRIVRLSFVEGEVQFQRPGGDWEDAKLNLPLQQGFRLQTGNGYAEVEFERGLAVRLANDSSLEFSELSLLNGRRVTRVNLSGGTAVITAHLSHDDDFSISASNLHLEAPHSAEFRVEASASDNWVTVLHGKINVESAAQQSTLGSGRTLHESAAEVSSFQVVPSPARDDFDKWVSKREEILSDAQSESVLQDSQYNTGFADLDLFGSWVDIPGYGLGWLPYGLGSSWTPFVAGQWMFMGNTGWNWVSDESWGWLPYHFGSWWNAPGLGWLWVPPTRGPLYWQPATATWVRTNNQLGWIPTAAAPLKPIKSSKLNAASRVVILASSAASSGSIKAAHLMAIQSQAAPGQIAPAPAPNFIPRSGQSATFENPSAARRNLNAASTIRTLRAPESFAAPKSSLPLPAPRSLAAPSSMPVSAPRVFRGAGVGGFYGANRGGSPGGARGMSGGGIAHSGGASGSAAGGASAGHH